MEDEQIVFFIRPENREGSLVATNQSELDLAIKYLSEINGGKVSVSIETKYMTQEEIDGLDEFKGY